MKYPKLRRNLLVIALMGLGGVGLFLAGCASSDQPTTAPANAESGKGGAQLWAENCMRCHNLRAPDEYSDQQWEVAVRHMQLRVPLTGEEYRKIEAFLRSGSGRRVANAG